MPLRVLEVLVGAGTRTGGPPDFIGGAAAELPSLGIHVEVVATDTALAPWGLFQRQRRIRPEEIHPALRETDLRLFPARFPRRLAFSPALAHHLRSVAPNYDLIHVHNLWQFPQLAAYRAASGSDVPYVVSPHGALDPYLRQRGRVRKSLTMKLWQRRMLAGALAIHVTTESERGSVADVAPAVPRAVVPCGVHVDRFAELPPAADFRNARLNGYDGPVVLFLGRITEKKGVDVLIRAFSRVRREHPSRLVIAGPDDSGLIPKLRRLIAELGMGSADVEFVGPVFGQDRLAALATADVWALSSHTENFGIAVVEAAAAGCAVVISRGVNLAADLEAAGAGVVAETDPDSFAAALLGVLTDDSRRIRLRGAAPKWAARYDWSRVAPQLAELYRAAVEDR